MTDPFPYNKNQIAEIKVSYHPYYNPLERWQIYSSDDAYYFFRKIRDMDIICFQEEVVILYLNNRNQVMGYYKYTK